MDKIWQAVEHLNRLIVNKKSQVHFTAPKSVQSARELRDNFRALEKAGSLRYYNDVSGVDVNEIFLRGVKRKRPASSEGEELRDVIIFLMTSFLSLTLRLQSRVSQQGLASVSSVLLFTLSLGER